MSIRLKAKSTNSAMPIKADARPSAGCSAMWSIWSRVRRRAGIEARCLRGRIRLREAHSDTPWSCARVASARNRVMVLLEPDVVLLAVGCLLHRRQMSLGIPASLRGMQEKLNLGFQPIRKISTMGPQ